MLSLPDRIWKRVKAAAKQNGQRRLRLNPWESEKVVRGIINSEDGPLPEDAVKFYARELIRLTEEVSGSSG